MFFILLLLSPFASSNYTEEFIKPHIGPYKLEKNISGECPKEISLYADCRMSDLRLVNTDNPDFVFLHVEGINLPESITTRNGKVIEKVKSSLKDKKVETRKSRLLDETWEEFVEKLELGVGKLSITREIHFKRKGKNEVQRYLDCSYLFDKRRYDEQITKLCKEHPEAYDCKKQL